MNDVIDELDGFINYGAGWATGDAGKDAMKFVRSRGAVIKAALELADAAVMYKCAVALVNLTSDPILVWSKKLAGDEVAKRADELNAALSKYHAAAKEQQ